MLEESALYSLDATFIQDDSIVMIRQLMPTALRPTG